MNIPLENVAPFTDKIFDANLVPEPNKHTQELYGALDSVVQAVLTDKNADIDQLLTHGRHATSRRSSTQTSNQQLRGWRGVDAPPAFSRFRRTPHRTEKADP